jgi:hypothetical protein
MFLEGLECGILTGSFKQGENTTETSKMFKVAFAEQKMERTQIFEVFPGHFECILRFVGCMPSTEDAGDVQQAQELNIQGPMIQ